MMNKELNYQGKKLCNLPIKLADADYEEVCRQVVFEAKKNKSTLAVYLMGGKWCPGISDLDIVVVYKDGLNPRPLRSPWQLSEKARYIFTHRYLNFDEASFKSIYFHYPKELSALRLLWGSEIKLRSPEQELKEEYRFLHSAMIFDILVNKLLLFPRYLYMRRLDVRRVVGELYSLVYTFAQYKNITGRQLGANFPEKITKLRQDWFARETEENIIDLLELIKEGSGLVLRLVGDFGQFVKNQELISEQAPKFINNKFRISFVDNWTAQKFLEEFQKGYIDVTLPILKKRIENFKLILPLPLSYFFLVHKAGDGAYSKLMSISLSPKVENAIKIGKGVRSYITAKNRMFEASLQHQGLFRVPFVYGFPLKKNRRPSRILRLLLTFLKN